MSTCPRNAACGQSPSCSSTQFCLRTLLSVSSFLSVGQKYGINEHTNVHVYTCVYTFTSTQAFRRNIVQTAVVPSVLNTTDFKGQFDQDCGFVNTGVHRGWHYWISLLLTIR
jgi:hypothetical protein